MAFVLFWFPFVSSETLTHRGTERNPLYSRQVCKITIFPYLSSISTHCRVRMAKHCTVISVMEKARTKSCAAPPRHVYVQWIKWHRRMSLKLIFLTVPCCHWSLQGNNTGSWIMLPLGFQQVTWDLTWATTAVSGTVSYQNSVLYKLHFTEASLFSGIMKWWAVEQKGRKVTRYQRPVCICYFKVKTVHTARGKGSVKAVSAEEFQIVHIFLGKNPQHFHLVRVVLC